MSLPSVLVLGYGNPARGDDGLGPRCVEALEALDLPGVTLDADYQLTVEDSAAVAQHDLVLFIDADAVGPDPYSLAPLEPAPGLGFSSHGIEPGALLSLVEQVFGRRVPAYMLGVRGHDFEHFHERLTEQGQQNLEAALAFIVPVLRARSFAASVTGRG